MSVYVFLGPSLPLELAQRELDAIYLPPAAAGDVYRVARRYPMAIGIVGGYFERVPSVWHKEILWSMCEGVHVFGAASMGALRAAELSSYGMVGVGRVFASFSAGELEDDDEVAVAHAACEDGYRSLSEAMVNIRATLKAAAAETIITEEGRGIMEHTAKSTYYADRTYERMLQDASERGASGAEVRSLRDWLPEGRVDVKKQDALEMLRVIQQFVAQGPSRKEAGFRFEHTHAWEMLQRRTWGERDEHVALPASDEAVLDELRLRGLFVPVREAALGRMLAIAQAQASGKPASDGLLEDTTEAIRRERGLLRAGQFRAWMRENDLTASDYARLVRDEANVRWVDSTLREQALRLVVDRLRLEGGYAPLRQRVLAKRTVLAKLGYDPATVEQVAGLSESALLGWYFTEWLGASEAPDDVARYAESVGFRDTRAMVRAIICEYLTKER